MSIIKIKHNRRSFLKVSTAAGGGILLGFNWLTSCQSAPEEVRLNPPKEWFDINAFLKIADNGQVTIMSPNPEIGQNVKTSMPMIVAEELDVDWEMVIVEQAPFNPISFTRQVAGGSQSIRKGWDALRMTGATARQMLLNAAAKEWNVDASELTTHQGVITNAKGEQKTYASVASAAATMEVPESVSLKSVKDFKIIGKSKKNVDLDNIITGKPLFGIDTRKSGMQYAAVMRPPAFGQTLVGFDDTAARAVSGVNDVIQIDNKIAVLAKNTWAALKGKKALSANWEQNGTAENTVDHDKAMLKLLEQTASEPLRADGDVDRAFAEADQMIERIYEAPFLPHNCLEPMNFYADVTADKAVFVGPIQTPEWTASRLAELLERKEEDISIMLTRMGGGFGRRLYGDFALEAAEISLKAQSPVQLIFSREDDMTAGTYRPASKYKFRASIKDGQLTGYELVGVGINMRNATRENNFPACAVDNYRVSSYNLESNITTGAWRAPVTNFLAYAEQTFLDEIAAAIEQDPVDFRLNLLARAEKNPVGTLQYEPQKMIGVIQLAAERADWAKKGDRHLGMAAYYSHNTYVAEVAEVNASAQLQQVYCAVDCGIVVNPDAAINQCKGGVVDGIGHAMYGDFSF
ncbi:MAG: molybdopterin cofactor-binding domain-containing protein, partial [Bacteroidota bacterium]